MRRTWYFAFGVVLLAVFSVFVMLGDVRWFLMYLGVLLAVGIYDVVQTEHAILRNFPILGHFRYLIEFIRPEIQQYIIASDQEERPYNRMTRSLIYQRSKNVRDTVPFGTSNNILEVGYTWVLHSMMPQPTLQAEPRVKVGTAACRQPYEASRLNISALSFGALSPNAIRALNLGAKHGGFSHNTGEGGLSPYHLQGGDLVFQIGTAYFGCRDEHGHFDPQLFAQEALRPEVKMIEIKISQGAKPSHGGILPAAKLTPEIAQVRHVPMEKDVLSPPQHSAFSTPIEFMHFIEKLRNLSEGKPIGFKLCVGRKEEFFAICKAMLATKILPDFITVDGAEGGTGAAPLEFSNRIGEPLEAGLNFVHNALVGVGLRDQIRVIASGKIATGFDMIRYLSLGADMCQAARAMMMALGCVQSKQCNANTCPTGVATQNERLMRGLVVETKYPQVAHFHHNTLHSFLEIMAALGVSHPSQLHPSMLMRRVDTSTVKSLDEIYVPLETGALLKRSVPEFYAKAWSSAKAESF